MTMPEQKYPSSVARGDRIAFLTQGFKPRALCGTVTDPTARDAAGRRCIRVAVDGRTYLARATTVRKLD
jgi:hypothetical protein